MQHDMTTPICDSAERQKQTCTVCQGSGEIASFKGESRFLLSREDCPICEGLGYVIKDMRK